MSSFGYAPRRRTADGMIIVNMHMTPEDLRAEAENFRLYDEMLVRRRARLEAQGFTGPDPSFLAPIRRVRQMIEVAGQGDRPIHETAEGAGPDGGITLVGGKPVDQEAVLKDDRVADADLDNGLLEVGRSGLGGTSDDPGAGRAELGVSPAIEAAGRVDIVGHAGVSPSAVSAGTETRPAGPDEGADR